MAYQYVNSMNGEQSAGKLANMDVYINKCEPDQIDNIYMQLVFYGCIF